MQGDTAQTSVGTIFWNFISSRPCILFTIMTVTLRWGPLGRGFYGVLGGTFNSKWHCNCRLCSLVLDVMAQNWWNRALFWNSSCHFGYNFYHVNKTVVNVFILHNFVTVINKRGWRITHTNFKVLFFSLWYTRPSSKQCTCVVTKLVIKSASTMMNYVLHLILVE